MYMYICTHMCVCICTYVYICAYVYVHMYTYVCMYMYICIHKYVCIEQVAVGDVAAVSLCQSVTPLVSFSSFTNRHWHMELLWKVSACVCKCYSRYKLVSLSFLYVINLSWHVFAGVCSRCHDIIKGSQDGCTAMDKFYHSTCFTCQTCSKLTYLCHWLIWVMSRCSTLTSTNRFSCYVSSISLLQWVN